MGSMNLVFQSPYDAIADEHAHFYGEVFDNLIPWLVEAIPTCSGSNAAIQEPDRAFELLRSLIEMDDEQIVAGRCGPGRDRAAWGTLFTDIFEPHQERVTAAVLASSGFAEACIATAAIILPGIPIPPLGVARWRQPFWRWPQSMVG